MVTKVRCPVCETLVAWSTENPYRPFCSERCKNIDLGAWSAGQYAIPDTTPREMDDGEMDEPS